MDTSLIHADIFFFVTTIAVIVVAVPLAILIIYLVSIARNIREITRHAKEEAELVRKDVEQLRAEIKLEGFRLEQLLGFLRNIPRTLTKKRKTRSKE